MKAIIVRWFGGDAQFAWATIASLMMCFAVALCLLLNSSEYDLSGDGARYLNVTEQLIAGQGLTITSLYYPSELAQTLPAQQTISSPGLPLLAAFLARLFSIEAIDAIMLINVSSHMMTCVLIWLIAAKLRAELSIAVLFVVAYASYPEAWSLVLSGMSEPLFVFLVVGIATCLAQTDDGGSINPKYLVAASLLAAAAVSVRYQAMPFIVALGLAVLRVRFDNTSIIKTATASVLVMAPAGITSALIILRNWQLIGSVRGGPDHGVGHSFGAAVRKMAEALYDILGMEAGVVSKVAAAALIASGVSVCAVYWKDRRKFIFRPENNGVLVTYCALGLLFNFGFVFFLTLSSTNFGFPPRYLLAGIPLMLVVAIALLPGRNDEPMHHKKPGFLLATRFVFFTSLLVILVLGSQRQIRWFEQHSLPRNLNRILETPYHTSSLRTYLSGEEVQSPILSNQSWALYVALQRPTIGIPASRFLSEPVTMRQIEALLEKFRVDHVIIFPENRVTNGPDVLFELMEQPNDFLEPAIKRDDIWIFEVNHSLLSNKVED